MDKIETILKNIEPIIMNCRKKTNIPSWQLNWLSPGRHDYCSRDVSSTLLDPQMMTLTSMFISKWDILVSWLISIGETWLSKRKFDQIDYCELSEAFYLFDQNQDVSENVMYNLLCQKRYTCFYLLKNESFWGT